MVPNLKPFGLWREVLVIFEWSSDRLVNRFSDVVEKVLKVDLPLDLSGLGLGLEKFVDGGGILEGFAVLKQPHYVLDLLRILPWVAQKLFKIVEVCDLLHLKI